MVFTCLICITNALDKKHDKQNIPHPKQASTTVLAISDIVRLRWWAQVLVDTEVPEQFGAYTPKHVT